MWKRAVLCGGMWLLVAAGATAGTRVWPHPLSNEQMEELQKGMREYTVISLPGDSRLVLAKGTYLKGLLPEAGNRFRVVLGEGLPVVVLDAGGALGIINDENGKRVPASLGSAEWLLSDEYKVKGHRSSRFVFLEAKLHCVAEAGALWRQRQQRWQHVLDLDAGDKVDAKGKSERSSAAERAAAREFAIAAFQPPFPPRLPQPTVEKPLLPRGKVPPPRLPATEPGDYLSRWGINEPAVHEGALGTAHANPFASPGP